MPPAAIVSDPSATSTTPPATAKPRTRAPIPGPTASRPPTTIATLEARASGCAIRSSPACTLVGPEKELATVRLVAPAPI